MTNSVLRFGFGPEQFKLQELNEVSLLDAKTLQLSSEIWSQGIADTLRVRARRPLLVGERTKWTVMGRGRGRP